MAKLELLGESSWRGPGSSRRPPFYKRTWFSALLTLFIMGCVGLFLGWALVWKPLVEKAATYDMEECQKLENASVIFDRYGGEIGRIYVMNRTPVTLDDVPMHLRKALIAQEDSRFLDHDGVDYIGIVRAVFLAVKMMKVTQGASTLTQQLARNTFELRERSIQRKLLEAFVAQRIEKRYTKDEIMTLYLNRIFFGSGNGQQFHGIQAAAMGYFGKHVRELNLEESATVVGLIKSPNTFSPLRNPQGSIKARNMVFHRMSEEGYITPEQEISLSNRPMITSGQTIDQRLTFVYDEVRRQVRRTFGEERAATGGFNIYTTIDPVLQQAAEQSVQRRLTQVESGQKTYEHQTYAQYSVLLKDFRDRMSKGQIDPATPKPDPEYLQGAALVMDNADGGILAVVGNRDYRHAQLNLAMHPTSAHPVGTAFTPIVFASAFKTTRFFPGTTYTDGPFPNQQVMLGAVGTGLLGEWGTEVLQPMWSMGESVSLRQIMAQGKNSGLMRLAYEHLPGPTEFGLNLTELKDLAVSMGIESPLGDTPPVVLGTSAARLDEMCLAYSCFANGGTRAKTTHLINRITDAQNKEVWTRDGEASAPVTALDEIAAYQTHSCLVDVLEHGTAAAGHLQFGLKKFPAAGKTGTGYSSKDLWFCGYSSAVTCSVWVGFDKKKKTIYEGAFSSRIALPVWCDIMNASLQHHKPEEFPRPKGMERMELCRTSGMRATNFCIRKSRDAQGREQNIRDTFYEWVRPGTLTSERCTEHEGEGLALDLASFESPIGQPNDATSVSIGVGVRPTGIDAVRIKAPTILGIDPYNAVKPSVEYSDEENAPKRATPVREIKEEVMPLKIAPPAPVRVDLQ